jgi:PAS domain S-box-containing protein
MGSLSRIVPTVGGRRLVVALGGMYVASAGGFVLAQVIEDRPVGEVVLLAGLLATSGAVLAYGGYRLPETPIRPDLFDVVAEWCLRAIGTMALILALGALADTIDDPVTAYVVLPALASVAGLGMGYHDARAKTRALDAEERRRETERYRTIVETVSDGIFVADADNRFRLVNDAYVDLVGYDREELIGSPTTIVADPDNEDVDGILETVERDLANDATDGKTYETTLRTASGESIDVEWTVTPMPKDGDEPDRAVVVRDVTERNERERTLERQNERLDSFASLLAHELRNPVNTGQIYSRQLDPAANPEAVEYVREAFVRIEDMIDVMLVITRGREAVSECSSIALEDAARAAWEGVDAPDATLDLATERTIRADGTYVRHLFRNLFENAVEHGGPDITVTVGDLPSGFYVADDGAGISPEERASIFEPGYTTASDHGGMGLGLTFVKEMADIYEWECSVTESADGGARFEFEGATKARGVVD